MRRTLAWLVVGACLLLASIYFAKHPSESAPQVREQPQEEPKPEIKAATPEDPGPIATVVAPIQVLTQNNQKKTQPPGPTASTPAPGSSADHVAVTSAHATDNFLHQRLRVTRYLEIGFVVPEYIKRPRVHGHFQSWTRPANRTERQPAEVDVLLLSEPEWAEFVHGERGTTSDSAGPAASQSIDWLLTPTSRQPKKYYLVFRNPAAAGTSLFVDADFSLQLE
jgi:hypothetical protein